MKTYKFKDKEKIPTYEELVQLNNVLSNKILNGGQANNVNITGGSLFMGSGDSCLKQGAEGIHLGNSAFASAPFSVSMAGALKATSATISGSITATSGVIGGWTVSANTLYTNGIILDAGNQKITVGATDSITIDGVNKYIQSSNYVSGVFGSGFHIDSNLLEVGNIAMRGTIRTALFQKDVISTVGGNLAVLDGDVLDADMTALDSATMTTKGTTTFSVGDILRIKDGTDDEWLEVLTNSATVIDSYSEINQDANPILRSGGVIYLGQSFTNINAMVLDSCKFYLKKNNSPTGNATAKIYAHTGTYGTDGKPISTALATSDNFDVSTLTTSYQLITFNFTGANRITLSAGTYYCIEINYSGGNISNSVAVGIDEASPSHSGNWSRSSNGTSWTTSDLQDTCFYVYGVLPTNTYSLTRDKAAAYTADTNPTWKKGATIVNYKQSGDGGVYMTASESNAPYLSIFDHAGSPWTTINTRLRIGNLNGYLGYSSDLFGIAIGEATKYLKYDPTNGLEIKGSITGGTITGVIFQTSATGQRITINSADNYIRIYNADGQIGALGGSTDATDRYFDLATPTTVDVQMTRLLAQDPTGTNFILYPISKGYQFSRFSNENTNAYRATNNVPILQLWNLGSGNGLDIATSSSYDSIPIRIQQGRVTSTNFRLILRESNTGCTMWISDGTTPNGNLTGQAGDICFNGNAGNIYRCTGTTNWTAM